MDITKFCGREDPRAYMNQPMRLGADVVATNGHVLVRWTDAGGDYPDAPDTMSGRIRNLTNGTFSGVHHNLSDLLLPPAKECRTCGGTGHHYTVECDECDGEGEFRHGSHWYECKECNGEGTHKTSKHSEGAKQHPCYRCDGHGDDFQVVRIGDSAFQRRYLALLKTLPGCQLEVGMTALATARFTFEGGHGFLMPCRD